MGAVYRRPRAPLSKASLRLPHGKPLHCPKCPEKHYYGKLKLPGERDTPCPNCGTTLVGKRNVIIAPE